ncbi:MAG TPA: hypothetical protein VEJ68_04970 [Candidatus Bathyarchaeia archaeon]|nr:hypothetical protein [Candidatus Bathyarchaeia archaeon]
MAIEKWVAAASFGMFCMFVAELVSISIFLKHPSYDIDPSSQMREFISISGAPALVLAGSSYLLARRYGSRLCGSLIIAGGIVTIIGMYYVNTVLVPNISPVYLVSELSITPILFMGVSVPVMVVGGLLFKIKPKPKRDYFFDR